MEIIEPNQLTLEPNAIYLDLNDKALYAQQHVAKAQHLDSNQLLTHRPPILGLLPNEADLVNLLNQFGITPEQTVYAYDDEGGNKAARLFWTLDVLGHQGKKILINGGVSGLQQSGLLANTSNHTEHAPHSYHANINQNVIADRQYIIDNLDNPDTAFLDCRSDDEYYGRSDRATHSGHIPGAVHVDWVLTLESQPYRHIRPLEQVKQIYLSKGVTPEKEIIAYCHSNNRSAHTYMVLKALGYPRVRAYDGGWSEWGNLFDTHIE